MLRKYCSGLHLKAYPLVNFIILSYFYTGTTGLKMKQNKSPFCPPGPTGCRNFCPLFYFCLPQHFPSPGHAAGLNHKLKMSSIIIKDQTVIMNKI